MAFGGEVEHRLFHRRGLACGFFEALFDIDVAGRASAGSTAIRVDSRHTVLHGHLHQRHAGFGVHFVLGAVMFDVDDLDHGVRSSLVADAVAWRVHVAQGDPHVPNFCSSEKETEDLGRRLAPLLRRGDCLTFTGDLGAGKTTLIRALIRELAGAPIDVPSPTYALVEAYEFETPIFHVDLYRLENQADAWELGLEDMFETGITLIEWPDRAEDLLPAERLGLTITHRDQGREVSWQPSGKEWTERMARWESA